jgi:hypothetical protein
MEWQPIETAPKDGTAVLLWLSGDAAFFDWMVVGSYDGDDAGWNDGITMFRLEPTHWMPLPRPPSDKGET